MKGRGPKPGTVYRRSQLSRLAAILNEDSDGVVRMLAGDTHTHVDASVRGHSYLGPGDPADFADDWPTFSAGFRST